MYFRVWYSDNRQPVFFKKSRSFFVISLSFLAIMPRTVKLYNELSLCTIKICNIPSENLLAWKADGVGTQKIILKVYFFFCHVLSQHFWVGTISLLCFLCITIPPSRYACHLPLHKGGLALSDHLSRCFDNMQFNSYKAVLFESHFNLSLASLYGSQISSVCSWDKIRPSAHSNLNEYSGTTYRFSGQP